MGSERGRCHGGAEPCAFLCAPVSSPQINQIRGSSSGLRTPGSCPNKQGLRDTGRRGKVGFPGTEMWLWVPWFFALLRWLRRSLHSPWLGSHKAGELQSHGTHGSHTPKHQQRGPCRVPHAGQGKPRQQTCCGWAQRAGWAHSVHSLGRTGGFLDDPGGVQVGSNPGKR